MATGGQIEQVTTIVVTEPEPTAPSLRLRGTEPDSDEKKAVKWDATAVDNENMGKKKSKCCCQYRKPADDDLDDGKGKGDCEHCTGHTPSDYNAKGSKNDATS